MRILVFLGPSGSGKSTVVRALHARRVVEVTPSWTTRPRREDERAGTVEHRFVDDKEFARLADGGFFLETVEMFGLPYRYGLPAPPVPAKSADGEPVPAIMVRASLWPLVVRHFPDHVAYQIEDTVEQVRARLATRGGGAELGNRLDGYEDERLAGRAVARRVFVNRASIGALVDEVAAAVAEDFPSTRNREEERCRNEA